MTSLTSPTSPTLVFSHGNSFPAGTYNALFEIWRQAGWRVEALPKFGHDPRFPVSSNWPHLSDELRAFIEALQTGPVYLVGHSMGGFVSLLLACQRPEWVRGVVLLDSPVVAGWRATTVQFAKATGLIKRFSPAQVSHRRRERWACADEALAHFASKPLFARWPRRVLEDYMACGLEAAPGEGGGVHLAFDRHVESRIYNTLPHHMPHLLKRHPPKAPVAFVGGTRSREIRQVGMAATQSLTKGRLRWIEGSHLFPLEHPEESAATVLDLLAEMKSA
ncbi:MAG: alpha/beta fold hydrolase [Leptothrix ochracea]|uniref:alpha/beta fold hydrolase n=1 Tax=Leptothrix ochracea TaxID=735331 RepID=UPI0034E22068